MDPQHLHLLILAVVQGITEFVPISSDGHMVVVDALWEHLYGGQFEDLLSVEIVLHGGTLLAILVMYWRQLVRLLVADRHMIGRIVVGSLPAAAIGLPVHKISVLHHWMESPVLAGLMLPVMGVLLLVGGAKAGGTIDYTEISYRQAFLIGLAQATAILPGISRSGTTIVAGLALGLRREAAATFSFVLAVPVVGGAVLLGVKEMMGSTQGGLELNWLLLATAVAFFVGLAALALLLRWLRQGRLWPMGWWCLAVGLLVTVWQAARWLGA